MKYYWWPLQTGLVLVSIFFLVFGVDLLLGSYSLKNPFHFIMTFFAACLIILISLTLAAGFIIRMAGVYKRLKHGPAAEPELSESETPESETPGPKFSESEIHGPKPAKKDTTMNHRQKEKP